MKISDGAKSIFKKTGGMAALAAPVMLSGCAVATLTTSNGNITLNSLAFKSESSQITGSCVWPRNQQEMTLTTANGDLYQVNVYSRYNAQVIGSIQGGNVEVLAYYDNNTATLYNTGTGAVEGLRISQVTPMNGQASLPSPDSLQSKQYAFRVAAEWGQKAVYNDRRYMPLDICPDSIRLHFYNDSGRAPRGRAVPLSPKAP